MKPCVIKPVSCLKGVVSLAGDKSIAHRALIISALSSGVTKIKNFPANKDCLSTLGAFKKLGIKIGRKNRSRLSFFPAITVFGKGLFGLKKPKSPIFVGDSGATLRLLLGVLAGQNFKTKLIAAESLSQRPMLRVNAPLKMMGAVIKARRQQQGASYEEYPPITICGGNLKPISYKMPVASAQVKSAILLAGLYAKGKTCVKESMSTRDHTERMLKLFKANIEIKRGAVVIKNAADLISPGVINIPGDISSAGFFMVAAAILPNSKVIIKNVTLNPLRAGIIKVLKRMNADIEIRREKSKHNYEPAGDLIVKSSRLKSAVVEEEEIPSLIDELPILMVAACKAYGKTVFKGVSELRVKEADRINSMVENLKNMGADISASKTGKLEKIVIYGPTRFKGAELKSFRDHRTAMSMIIAGLAADNKSRMDDIFCINKSFPGFLNLLNTLIPG